MKIGYAKLGRSWNLNPAKASTVGGDLDVIRLLQRLSWNRPQDDFILVGRNSGEDPISVGLPNTVVNPWQATTYNAYGLGQFKMPTVNYDKIVSGGRAYIEEYLDAWRRQAEMLPSLDAMIVWVGQHGGSNTPLPQIGTTWEDNKLTTPQMAFVNYCSYLLDFLNKTGVPTIFLNPDPRNYWKARELTAPMARPILGQFNETRVSKHEQYESWNDLHSTILREEAGGHREESVWVTKADTVYAGIEMTALDHPGGIDVADAPGEHMFGLISNENRKEVTRPRLPLVKELFRMFPDMPLFGNWSEPSMKELGRTVTSVKGEGMYPTLRTFRSTITLPASGSGWATAKPWECFAAGTVCFFHKDYDTQGHILPNIDRTTGHAADPTTWSASQAEALQLADFLRVRDFDELKSRVERVRQDDELWQRIVSLQRQYFVNAFEHWNGGMRAVEEQLTAIEVAN